MIVTPGVPRRHDVPATKISKSLDATIPDPVFVHIWGLVVFSLMHSPCNGVLVAHTHTHSLTHSLTHPLALYVIPTSSNMDTTQGWHAERRYQLAPHD